MEKLEINYLANKFFMDKVSIVLLLKNAEKYLPEILCAIQNQKYEGGVEVIAIDSGSKDRTLSILSDFGIKPYKIKPSDFDHGATRNLGLQLCNTQSKYVVYLTQDATPANNYWLKNLLLPMIEDNQVAGVFSRHLPRPNSTPSMVRQLTQNWQTGGNEKIIKSKPLSEEEYQRKRFFIITFSNTSSAIRRTILEKYPFPKTSFAEDMQWAERVIQEGYKIVYEPLSQVIHSHDYSLIEHFRQNVDHSCAMKKLFSPAAYSQTMYWCKVFGGIPREVWRDWLFINQSTIFKNVRFNKKLYYIWYSIWWHLATSLGSYIGSILDIFPESIKIFFVRQERIKKL